MEKAVKAIVVLFDEEYRVGIESLNEAIAHMVSVSPYNAKAFILGDKELPSAIILGTDKMNVAPETKKESEFEAENKAIMYLIGMFGDPKEDVNKFIQNLASSTSEMIRGKLDSETKQRIHNALDIICDGYMKRSTSSFLASKGFTKTVIKHYIRQYLQIFNCMSNHES